LRNEKNMSSLRLSLLEKPTFKPASQSSNFQESDRFSIIESILEVTSNNPSEELEKLIKAVTNALTSYSFCEFGDFTPIGCEWFIILSKHDSQYDEYESGNKRENFWVQVICVEKNANSSLDSRLARSFRKKMSHSIEVILRCPEDPYQERDKCLAEERFQLVSSIVQKELSRLEFPHFRDGNSGKAFKELYQLNEEINRGASGVVFRGTRRENGKTVAVKAIDRSKLTAVEDATIFTEVALMSSFKQPNIVCLYDFFQEPDWYLIILEYLDGGDLFDRIGMKKSYNEEDARDACRSLIKAVKHCHDNSIAHLDLKSKNLLLVSQDNHKEFKIADFGFATRFSGPNCLTRRCGTPFFVAPEIIRREKYDQRADMWSLGVIIYLLLSGNHPFSASSTKELFQRAVQGNPQFPNENWSNVSEEAKDLIRHLLVVDPEKRWCANRTLRCPWLRKEGIELKQNDLSDSTSRIKNFNAGLKLKAAVYAVEFTNFSYNEIEERRKIRINNIYSDSFDEESDADENHSSNSKQNGVINENNCYDRKPNFNDSKHLNGRKIEANGNKSTEISTEATPSRRLLNSKSMKPILNGNPTLKAASQSIKIQDDIYSIIESRLEVTSNDPSQELEKLVSVVSKGINSFSFTELEQFTPHGCEWVFFISKNNAQCKGLKPCTKKDNFWVQVVCVEKNVNSSLDSRLSRSFRRMKKMMSHSIEMVLKCPENHNQPSDRTMAKERFLRLSYQLRKLVAQLEFPAFPDGNSGRPFKEVYKLNEEINRGSYGIVFRGKHKETGDTVAVKAIKRENLNPDDDAAIFTEVALMSSLKHHNIVRLIDFFEETDWYLIILEYSDGGDLFDRIGRKKSYNEQEARDACRSLIQAVKHCHDNSIAHLDLKSKNLLLISEENDTEFKVADFGFATRFSGPNCLTRRVGTPFFIAPEIIRSEKYDQRADMWSLGIIIYLLLSGNVPFTGRNVNELFHRVLQGNLQFPDETWCNVSEEAKDLIRHLLVIDTRKRWCANRTLRCLWLRKEGIELKRNDLADSISGIKNFNAGLKLKAAVYAVEFTNFSYNEIRENIRIREKNTNCNESVDTTFEVSFND